MADVILEAGVKAPVFELPDQDDRNVSLNNLAGNWVVLYFYPKDDTPGCTTEACEFTESIAQFQDLDALVLGVSPDSPASHRRFIEKHHLKVRLLSDPDHKVMDAYGAWGVKQMYGKETVGVIRSTILIDPQGNVARHWSKVQAEGHAAKVCDALAELRG